MATGLEHLLAEGVISEVLARLQSGKEAEVYVVRFGGKVVAAKVYKDRAQRSFKNNSAYKEGRTVRNSRSQRAIDRGSSFGKAAAEDAWKTAEADALYKLHAAEVRVPTPVLYLDGVLLMELVENAEGNAARRLIDTDLTLGEANAAYYDMVIQLVRILSCDLIHGDLSPYNVLWGAHGPVIIDFPQIISASHNSSSEQFFLRDAENILGHFVRIDRSLASRRSDAWEIWQAYRRRELTPDFRPTGQSRPMRPVRPEFAGPRPHAGGPSAGSYGGNRVGGERPASPRPHDQGGRPGPGAPRPQGGPPPGPRRDGPRGPSVQNPQAGRRPQGAPPPQQDRGPRGVRVPEVIVRPVRGGAPSAVDSATHVGNPSPVQASPPLAPQRPIDSNAPRHRPPPPANAPHHEGNGPRPEGSGTDDATRPHRRRRRRR